jgi:dTDP-4-dehydrorhamnose 3,5-epimerase
MELQGGDHDADVIYTRMGRQIPGTDSRGKDLPMIFNETSLKGVFIIEPKRLEDQRGFFARSWCQREFEAHGLNPRIVQCNISLNTRKGTLRGMHYQVKPFEEAKLVRCTKGAIHDVIVDIRPDSPTFKKYAGFLLTADNRLALCIPEGFAHGFLTLEDNTEVFYQMSEFYAPDHARGFRWNDPAFKIQWPEKVEAMSDRDRNYPDFVASGPG